MCRRSRRRAEVLRIADEKSAAAGGVAAKGLVHLDEQRAAVGHLGQPHLLVDHLDDAACGRLGSEAAQVGGGAGGGGSSAVAAADIMVEVETIWEVMVVVPVVPDILEVLSPSHRLTLIIQYIKHFRDLEEVLIIE